MVYLTLKEKLIAMIYFILRTIWPSKRCYREATELYLNSFAVGAPII
jgi:hypothetical protein